MYGSYVRFISINSDRRPDGALHSDTPAGEPLRCVAAEVYSVKNHSTEKQYREEKHGLISPLTAAVM